MDKILGNKYLLASLISNELTRDLSEGLDYDYDSDDTSDYDDDYHYEHDEYDYDYYDDYD